MAHLAIVSWPLGEVDRAISLIDRMQTRMADLTHVGTLANGRMYAALFELMRGDSARAAQNAFEARPPRARARAAHVGRVRRVSRGLGDRCEAARSATGSSDMRRGVELLRAQNVLMFDGLVKIALAEAEAQAGDSGRAIAILDEALATSDRIGYRAFEAELHRVRGDTPAQTRPRQSRACGRGFPDRHRRREAARDAQLRTARCALARQALPIDRSPRRGATVLTPALDGFAPTKEMPEIDEALEIIAAIEAGPHL